MRYAILRDLLDLADVAALWPFSSIEERALWIYEAADQGQAELFARERFPNRSTVTLPLSEAESVVRQHLENMKRHQQHGPGRAA